MVQTLSARIPATRRALAKQQTRQRLLAAAKQLVSERGYDAATLRDVASLADVSTGAVFANFTDKADLFNEVIVADLAALLEQIDAVEADDAAPRETLLEMLALGYAINVDQLSLVKAQMGFSWSCDCATDRQRDGVRAIIERLAQVLRGGIDCGVLAATLDPCLIAEMAWECYLANYRLAVFDGWTIDALRARIAAQLDILLDGYLIRARQDAQTAWPSMVRGLEAARRPTQATVGVLHPTALRG
jgi:AcrR family transcriptional regulator